jgi:hypothetical protein
MSDNKIWREAAVIAGQFAITLIVVFAIIYCVLGGLWWWFHR